jgi:hypothetical protein
MRWLVGRRGREKTVCTRGAYRAPSRGRSSSPLGSAMTRKGLTLVALALLAAGAFAGTAKAPRVSGIYSNLHWNAEGGDLLGIELFVVPRDTGSGEPAWSVFVQIAEGGAPCAAVVPLTVMGDRIEFTLPKGSSCAGLHFVGTLSPTEITLRWDAGTVEHLKRGKSYWQ